MNSLFKFFSALFILSITLFLLSFSKNENDDGIRYRYKLAGLTDRPAAAHLSSPEFWGKEAIREKTKSAFEGAQTGVFA